LVLEKHETPSRKLMGEPEGLGVGRIDHVLPFQDSASV
jgi:hypothetical protein